MSQPQGEVFRAMLERVCASSGMAVVLTDDGGGVVWWNRYADEEFPFMFAAGKLFKEILEECTRLELGRMDPPAFERSSQFGDLRRAVNADGGTIIYRHVRLHLEEAGAGYTLHCLVNVSREKKLEESFLHNLRQLRSMREISDTLYESLSTQEVMYLILIAVTSQIGFGFNRAFFLEVGGSRLRGRIGIGPSNHEEAHQIWSRLAHLKFSSLREVYQDLTRSGGVPDARTQEIALTIDFPLAGPVVPGGAASVPANIGRAGPSFVTDRSRKPPARIAAAWSSIRFARTCVSSAVARAAASRAMPTSKKRRASFRSSSVFGDVDRMCRAVPVIWSMMVRALGARTRAFSPWLI
jgi:hypothetical protein